MRRLLFFAALLAVAAGPLISTSDVAAGPSKNQNVASDSYYTFDVDAGQLDVRVEATIQATRFVANEVYLWTMLDPQDLLVKRGETKLDWTIARDKSYGAASIITIPLDRPLAVGAQADFTMSYRVSNLEKNTSLVMPGIIALGLVSQGAGSFVFADLPSNGDNYFDPGCLKLASQPSEVASRGFERWVCGETPMIALHSDDPSVIRQCENLDARCRQRTYNWPYAAYAQSVTSDSQVGKLVATVDMDRGPVELTLKYFKRDAAWAEEQFAVAKAAFPLLEDLFGFPYSSDKLLMRESYQIYFLGIAGLAFPEQGEVLLVSRTGFDTEVTVHELAHQWAGFNLATSWLWEGQAEWATGIVGPQVGVTIQPREWESLGYTDPLATWYAGSAVLDPDYWYGKAGAFWSAYEQAVGGREAMQSVLSRSGQRINGKPLDGRWFMNRGEEQGGVILDDLFLKWVFQPLTAKALLTERRDAIKLVEGLEADAAAVGIVGVPPDIAVNLEEWVFDPVAGQVQAARAVITEYQRLQSESERLDVPFVAALNEIWATRPITESSARLAEQQVTIQAIFSEKARLASEPSEESQAKLDEAIQAYLAGDFRAAKRLVAESVSHAVSDETAGQLVQFALDRKSSFSPNVFQKIGLLGQSPDKHLAAAEQALAEGNSSEALKEASAALDAWDGSRSRGFLFVGLGGLVMCVFSVCIWWLIRRLEGDTTQAKETWERFEIGDLRPGDGERTKEPGSFWRELDNH